MDNYTRILQEFADSCGGSGAAARITHKGKDLYRGAAGYADIESRRPMECGSVFRIFSMTKMIVGAAALKLFEQGWFQLDDPVSAFIPAYRDTKVLTYQFSDRPTLRQSSKQVTMRHLFTMTAGFAYPGIATKAETPRRCLDGAQFSAEVFEQIRRDEKNSGVPLTTRRVADYLAAIPMCFEPGEGWIYGLCADILGAVVSEISGKPLGQYIDEVICKPLGMRDTTFHPTREQLDRKATIYNCADPAKVTPLAAGPAASSIKPQATEELEICIGGMYSTLDDFSVFMQMLANGGTLGDVRILGRKTVELMAADHLTPVQHEQFRRTWYPAGFCSWGLMTRVSTSLRDARIMLFPGSFGWAGAAGTIACADPREKLSLTFMTQRIPSASYAAITKLMQVAYGEID